MVSAEQGECGGFVQRWQRQHGCAVADCINLDEMGCFYCIDADGNLYSRDRLNAGKWETNDNFDKTLAEVIKKSHDCYFCKIDIHD